MPMSACQGSQTDGHFGSAQSGGKAAGCRHICKPADASMHMLNVIRQRCPEEVGDTESDTRASKGSREARINPLSLPLCQCTPPTGPQYR
jgi:hypothetical protein